MQESKKTIRKSDWILVVGILVTITGSLISIVSDRDDASLYATLPDMALVAAFLILLTVTVYSLLRSREAEKTEKALKESEKRYRELADSLPEVIFEMDLQGNLMWVNKTAFQVFGYGFSDFEPGKMNALDMIITEDRERAARNIARICNGEEIGLSEYTCIRNDDTTFPALFSTKLVTDVKGNLAGFRGVILDITQRKNAEKLMREEVDRTNRWFEELKEGAYVSSVKEGILLNANASAAESLGYENVNEAIGRETKEFFTDPKQRDSLLAEIKTHGFVRNRIINMKKKDGTPIQVATTVYLKRGKLYGWLLPTDELSAEHLIPICSVMECRKIRDKSGQWHRFENYFTETFDYRFSHSICPSCAQSLYPEEDLD